MKWRQRNVNGINGGDNDVTALYQTRGARGGIASSA